MGRWRGNAQQLAAGSVSGLRRVWSGGKYRAYVELLNQRRLAGAKNPDMIYTSAFIGTLRSVMSANEYTIKQFDWQLAKKQGGPDTNRARCENATGISSLFIRQTYGCR